MKLTGCLAALCCTPFLAGASSSRAVPRPWPVQLARQTAMAQAGAPDDADAKKPAGIVLARGKIKAITRPPRPRSVPYRDAIIAIQLADVEAMEGKTEEKEVLVFLWGMRDNKWTAAADYRVGQTLELALQPWDEVVERYGAYHRIELEGEDAFLLEPYWGEAAKDGAPN